MSRSEVFIDSSVLVGLHLGDERARELVERAIEEGHTLLTNPIVFSETVYKVMFTLAIQDGLKGTYDLTKHLNDYIFVYEKVKESLERLSGAGFLKVAPITENTIKLAAELGKAHNLLPNDAIIVATCREHGIKLILTFDSDFKRVPFLKTFGEEP
ncbi:type II toxin-antitoxin system VapC family toxin [Thermococcus sp. MV11]|uniref:type II toxin-antitoxin system VapC family toxin n=1 Tax=Thermococcus sp. MV11 TaxID=1638267 RepID=UPI00143155D4|nr:type II toxin-antitoxin system VapC family toxin [Thermococcus sp. MV11]NJE03993.1 PIN domain-containing protein [Thermococcus sp. MV11]